MEEVIEEDWWEKGETRERLDVVAIFGVSIFILS